MRSFEKMLAGMSRDRLPDLARELLLRLEPSAGEPRPAGQGEQPGEKVPERPKPGYGEPPRKEPFPLREAEEERNSRPPDAREERQSRDGRPFPQERESPREPEREHFPDVGESLLQRRRAAAEKLAAGLELPFRGGTGTAAEREDEMERISEFFRRDGRRYDCGFRRY